MRGQPFGVFAAVVIATHPDQALALLADPVLAERSALGAFLYSRNSVLLHTDARPLPAALAVRASWNYLLRSCRAHEDGVQVSYPPQPAAAARGWRGLLGFGESYMAGDCDSPDLTALLTAFAESVNTLVLAWPQPLRRIAVRQRARRSGQVWRGAVRPA